VVSKLRGKTEKDKLTKKWQKEIDRLKEKISKGFKERDFVKVYEYARKKEELESKIMEG
jgi:cupin superfamily acireductone dioxygenase involved in methionine salvage